MTSTADIFDSMAYGPAPENAAEAEKWLDGHDRRFGLFIGGDWRMPGSGETFESFNPATARPLAEIAQHREHFRRKPTCPHRVIRTGT